MPTRKLTVFTAGCFNRLHPAHARMLRLARALGDRLVVVLTHDAHNHKPKAVSARERLKRILGLKIADQVIVGDAGSFVGSLEKIRPDVVALGYDQRLPDDETARFIEKSGVQLVTLPWMPGKYQEYPLWP